MSDQTNILDQNRDNYEDLYSKEEAFLRYPADWIIRFHNMFLKNRLSDGAAILDYGCGGGNNSCFFLQKGYAVSGVDVAPEFKNLLARNLELHDLDPGLQDNFSLIDPASTTLDFPDNHFDFVFSNQVLYYLPSIEHIKRVAAEIKRVLRPGGYVFFTMIGLKNYYMTHHLRQIHDSRVYEIRIEDPQHRLNGIHEFLLPVRDESDLCDIFDMFEPVTVGYFDQSLFDVHSNFHYIYAGAKTG